VDAIGHELAGSLHAFSPDRPLLLLTDFSPDAQGGGAVILRSLLTEDDRRRIVWVTLSHHCSAENPEVVSLASSSHRSLMRDATLRAPSLRRAVRRIMVDRGAAAAWIVAHGPAAHVGLGLLGTGVPAHVTVHDDPAYLWLTRRYVLLAPLLGRDLRSLLRRGRSLDVVSREMADHYRRIHDGDITVVHRGLPDSVVPSPVYDRDEVAVAVLGSTYGLSEVKVLGRALELVGRQLGVPVRLTVIGGGDRRRVNRALPRALTVDLPGHLDEQSGIARLRKSFLLYLSYPFRRRGKMLRTMSFPTKLSTYVQAARPILMHMPADNTVAFLGETAPYATSWSSLAPDEGAEIIAGLWRQERMRETFHIPADAVRADHFDLASNRRALLHALNALAT
jgi:hypothetical protein